MNRSESQKMQETAFLEKFRGVYERFPSGEVISSEAPDFVVQGDGACIGIEVTEFPSQPPSGEPARAQENRIIRAGSKVYLCSTPKSRGLPPDEVVSV